MLTATIPYTKLQFDLLKKFTLTPYEWQNGAMLPNLIPRSSKRKWHIYRSHLATHALYSAGTLINYLLTLKDIEMGHKMMAILFLLGSILSFFLRLTFVVEEDGLIDMNRALLQFEGSNQQVRTKQNDLVTKSIQLMGIFAALASPILIGAIIVRDPCMPPFMGYVMMSRGGVCYDENWHWLAKICLALPDVILWYGIFATSSYYAFCTCFVHMRCLAHNLAHVVVMLRSNSYRGRGRGQIHRDHEGFAQYRQIQLIARIFNEVYQGPTIPTLMLSSVCVLCTSLYTCVKLHNSIPMPGFIVFPCMMMTSLNVIFIVKQGAAVLAQSEKCLEVARNNSTFGKKTVYKKMARAMGRVVVRFGSTNFVDELTPFNLINHALDSCVNAMLLT